MLLHNIRRLAPAEEQDTRDCRAPAAPSSCWIPGDVPAQGCWSSQAAGPCRDGTRRGTGRGQSLGHPLSSDISCSTVGLGAISGAAAEEFVGPFLCPPLVWPFPRAVVVGASSGAPHGVRGPSPAPFLCHLGCSCLLLLSLPEEPCLCASPRRAQAHG